MSKFMYMKSLLTIIAFTACSYMAFGIGTNPSNKGKAKKTVVTKAVKKHAAKQASCHMGLINTTNAKPRFGIEVGFSAPLLKDAKKPRFTVGADAGYFFSNTSNAKVYVKPNIGYTVPLTSRINVQTKMGAGVMVNNANTETNNNASTQPMLSFSVQPNVNVYNSKKYRYDAYLRYEFAAQSPYNTFSNLIPLTMLQFGVNIQGSDSK